MVKEIFATLVLASSIASAAPRAYSIESNLTINGKFSSTARIITLANEQAMVTQKDDSGRETFIAVTPSEGEGEIKGRKAILMKFIVGVIENGQRKVLGEPQIMTAENNKATISVGRPGTNTEQFSLTVVAERK